VQWWHSYVVDDKTFCIYLAENEAAVQEHARLSGFPANKVSEVRSIIDPRRPRPDSRGMIQQNDMQAGFCWIGPRDHRRAPRRSVLSRRVRLDVRASSGERGASRACARGRDVGSLYNCRARRSSKASPRTGRPYVGVDDIDDACAAPSRPAAAARPSVHGHSASRASRSSRMQPARISALGAAGGGRRAPRARRSAALGATSRPTIRVLDVTVVLLTAAIASTADRADSRSSIRRHAVELAAGEAKRPFPRARRLDRRRRVTSLLRGRSSRLPVRDPATSSRPTSSSCRPSGWDVQGEIARRHAAPALACARWHARGPIAGDLHRRRVPRRMPAARRPARGPRTGAWPRFRGARAIRKSLARPDQFVTEDGPLLVQRRRSTPRSILSLYLVEKFSGHEVALQCAKSLLLSMPRGTPVRLLVVPLSRPHSDDKIRHTEEYLRRNFDREVSIDCWPRVSPWVRAISSPLQGRHRPLPRGILCSAAVSAAREMFEHGARCEAVSQKIG
jgi:hypothetical protein